jgi:hypothetical protein
MHPYGALDVVVTNEPKLDGLTVTIVSFLGDGDTAGRAPVETTFRGNAGVVHLANLEPGRYDLTVSAKGLASTVMPGVHVAEGTSHPASVMLAAPTTVRGTVKSSNQPIAGAQVTVGARIAFTDGKGRWSIGDVAPGPIAIVVVKQGFGNAWISSVAADKADPVEVDLRPAGDGAGMVDGVGIVLSPAVDGAIVASVLPGSPAEGKLVAGDVISEVDGTSVTTAAVDEIVARLRGSAGSSVSITVQRHGDASTVDVVRRRLVVPQGTPVVAIASEHAAGGRRC